jgi:hypothetical protein
MRQNPLTEQRLGEEQKDKNTPPRLLDKPNIADIISAFSKLQTLTD